MLQLQRRAGTIRKLDTIHRAQKLYFWMSLQPHFT